MRGYPLLITFGCISLGIGLSYFYRVSLFPLFICLLLSVFLSLRWQVFLLFALTLLGMFYSQLRMPPEIYPQKIEGTFEVYGSLSTGDQGKFYLSRYLNDGIYKIKGSIDVIPPGHKRSYLWSRGFYKMLKVESFTLVRALKDPLLKRFKDLYPEDVAYFLYGAISGDKRGLPADLRSVIYRSGLGHLLAVSGFHVTLLAGILFLVLRFLTFSPRFAIVLSLFGLSIYLGYIGFQPSALRAYFLFIFLSFGKLLGLRVSYLNLLGACGLILAVWNPFVVWDAGFQLSFAAFFFIALTLESKLPYYWVYLAPQLGTFPILLLRFGYLPLASFLSNLFAIPLFSFAFTLGFFSLIPFIGEFLAPTVSFVVEFIFFTSYLFLKLLPSINL
ncbi:MAG: ComE operon protein 3 [bacterium 42_11]|nr:MAG: ComE operon protein 3 [bacterium 42_11]